MTSTGIQRKVDDLGRIVIPIGVRRSLGIAEGDRLEVSVEDERIVLVKPRELCALCSSEDDLVAFRGRLVCATCIEDLADSRERAREVQLLVLDEPVAPKSRKA